MFVQSRGIRNISNQCIHVVDVLFGKPTRVQVADDGSGVDEISVMEMVVIVEGIAKVCAVVPSLVGC